MHWQIDGSHSTVEFSVRHMMLSKVRGRFESFSGTVEFNEEAPTASSVEVTIDIASLNTRDAKRDGHLLSPDFFDVEKFPKMHFKSTRIERINDNHGLIYGELTIRDVTREVVLDTEYAGQAKAPWGTISAGFSASTKINRTDWGMTWNSPLETGGVLVGEEVTITIELEIVQVSEQPAEAVA